MSSFASLSALARAFFALSALSCILVNVISLLLAIVKRRYWFSALALLLIVPSYLMWQVVFDVSLSIRAGITAAKVSLLLGDVAWLWWLLVSVILAVGTALLLAYNIRYERNYITPNSIKTFLDRIPCGVCCWQDNGRVLFSNICMNRLCYLLTDGPLRNGNQFAEAVSEGILSIDGKMWRFACRDIVLGNERLHEMIASDVTTEYAKTQALEQDKAELSGLKHDLEEYNLGIDETIRRQEILQAKVNIHDEMNRLMLSTMAAEGDDPTTLDKIFALWEQNALLLCMQAEQTEDKQTMRRVEELAEALKIALVWQEPLPTSLGQEARALFFSAAQEAIANAAKHAKAKALRISFTSSREGTCCTFANDGEMPTEEVRFTGGLANLSRLAAKEGATVAVTVGEAFVLTLTLPPQNRSNG